MPKATKDREDQLCRSCVELELKLVNVNLRTDKQGSRTYQTLFLACILSVPIIEMLLPRLNPYRFSAEGVYKLVLIVPFLACWFLSIYAGRKISVTSRFYYGFLQSLAIVYLIFAEYRCRLHRSVLGVSGNDSLLIIALMWTGVIIVYTSMFTVGTTMAIRFTHRRTDVANDSHCSQCGYSLRGLPEPRCPECGAAFDPALLKPSE